MPIKDREQQKIYLTEWYQTNLEHKRAYAILRYNIGNNKLRNLKRFPCIDCKRKFPSYVMQFDHIGTDKKFNLSKAQTRAWEIVLEEINKCELVCANCHFIRTHQRRCNENPCSHE